MGRKLFCDINPVCYKISEQKEVCKRHIKNFRGNDKFAKRLSNDKLDNVVYSHSSNLIKKGKGVEPQLQRNKAVNIDLACKKINGIIIHPGEVFSFWGLVGKTTKRKGYMDGRVIEKNKLKPGIGGGLCNLSNTIHLLVLHSPLTVTEFHMHSDALVPDEGKRVPFSAGTSVNYNYQDYRFRNDTDQDVQLLVWCENDKLFAELRSEKAFPWSYEIVEENHHFKKEKEKFYRNSKIYRNIYDVESGKLLDKELILNNHSEVMFDYDLIPKDLIKS